MAGTDRQMNSFAPVQDAAYVYAEDANGNQVKIRKSDLASIIGREIGVIPRISISSPLGGYRWVRIMEFHNGSNGSFILALSSFANQPNAVIAGCVGVYDNRLISADFKCISGSFGGSYQPGIRYKFTDNKLIVWALNSIVYGHYIYILRGGANTYPMIDEEPPIDAITPTP